MKLMLLVTVGVLMVGCSGNAADTASSPPAKNPEAELAPKPQLNPNAVRNQVGDKAK